MEFNIIPDEEALGICAWCQSHIDSHVEVLGLGAKLRPDVDLSEYESHCIQIGLISRGKACLYDGNGSRFGSQKQW